MLVLIWGTRPEALKLGPIAACLRAHQIPFRSLATGQHTTLLGGTPAETDLADSESLGIPSRGDVMAWFGEAIFPLKDALRRHQTSLVVVQGDTVSALAGAEAAAALEIPVAHVEAGVRSHDLHNPFPEEGFRRTITQLATYHFAPTLRAYDNLIAEGVSDRHIYLTGNPIVSAIARYADVEPVKVPDMKILFTMHRREWLLGGIRGVLDGFLESALRYPEVEIIWPMHPGVAKQVPESWRVRLPSNVRLVEPMEYRQTLRLLAGSLGVATDSGGLQEEAACLGVPCAVLRRVTDRPESVEAGVARLYDPTEEGVIAAFQTLRDRTIPRKPIDVYGTPMSAEKIATTLGTLSTRSLTADRIHLHSFQR